jgi:hypothetical protein
MQFPPQFHHPKHKPTLHYRFQVRCGLLLSTSCFQGITLVVSWLTQLLLAGKFDKQAIIGNAAARLVACDKKFAVMKTN